VQEVGPGVADLPVSAGDLGRGLDPVRRPFLAAGQALLVTGQIPGLARQVPRLVPAAVSPVPIGGTPDSFPA